MSNIKEKVISKIKLVYDPEIPIDIYDLGLIYDIDFETLDNDKTKCIIKMTLTSPACPVAGTLVDNVKKNVLELDDIDEVKVKLTFTPPWTSDKISEDGREVMEIEGTHIKFAK